MLSISTLSAVMLRVVASSPTNFSPQLCDAGGCDLLLSKSLASFGLKSIVTWACTLKLLMVVMAGRLRLKKW
jgi:hypothetical protein